GVSLHRQRLVRRPRHEASSAVEFKSPGLVEQNRFAIVAEGYASDVAKPFPLPSTAATLCHSCPGGHFPDADLSRAWNFVLATGTRRDELPVRAERPARDDRLLVEVVP